MMNLKVLLYTSIFALMLIACEKKNDEKSNPKITEFSFLANHNSGLSKDAVATVSPPYILVEVADNVDLTSLVATFGSEGHVSVNGENQISGISINDFSKDVLYTVTADDGSTATYTARVKIVEKIEVARMDIINSSSYQDVNKEDYISSTIKISGSENAAYNIEAVGGIRGRGNSTWHYEKKPYRIKFDSKIGLLGLKAEKSWVLLANYLDPTLLMNAVTFEIGQRLGLPYTNHTRYVELYWNNEYMGNYMVTEQVEVKTNRVDMDEETGCLLEIDGYFDEAWKFRSSVYNLPVMIKSPEDLTDAMDTNIKKWFGDLENALSSSSFPNTGYADFIDAGSLIDFLMINDLVLNGEAQKQPKSVYMHKNTEGKFFMGPLWDFDWGFGFDDKSEYFFWPDGELLFKAGYTGEHPGAMFFCRFFDDPAFRAQYKERWNKVKPLYFDNIGDFIDRTAATIKDSQQRDFDRWHTQHHTAGKDYDGQISQMKEWLKKRIAYMDKEINKF